MKTDLITFLIFFVFSSVMVDTKSKTCISVVEERFFYKGKLIKVVQSEKGFFSTTTNPENTHFQGKKLMYDSTSILPVSYEESAIIIK